MAAKHFVFSNNPLSKDRKPQEKAMKKKALVIAAAGLLALVVAGAVAVTIPMLPGKGKVTLAHLANGDYRLMVGGRPYFIKGVCYIPTPIGKGYDYDLWTDPGKPWLVDGKLMKEMGINTVRFYFHSKNAERGREVMSDLYERFGIRSALGSYLDFWQYPPANYGLPEVRARIREDVTRMVNAYKSEPGLLVWVLGNENNYSFDRGVNPWTTEDIEKIQDPIQRRNAKAEIYYKFVNELAGEIKKIDPAHPVVMGNGELASIQIAKKICPNVDILGGIMYTGRTFGNFWKRVKKDFGKPAIMIEFGCDSYDAYKQKEAQDYQALFLKSLWNEIDKNRAGGSGEGNSLGGFVFEWSDEWWKHDEERPAGWFVHNTEGSWSNGSYYFDAEAENNMNEEWWGIVGLEPGGPGPGDKRAPKKSYYILKSLWKNNRQ
jgi:beta-galactosidase